MRVRISGSSLDTFHKEHLQKRKSRQGQGFWKKETKYIQVTSFLISKPFVDLLRIWKFWQWLIV